VRRSRSTHGCEYGSPGKIVATASAQGPSFRPSRLSGRPDYHEATARLQSGPGSIEHRFALSHDRVAERGVHDVNSRLGLQLAGVLMDQLHVPPPASCDDSFGLREHPARRVHADHEPIGADALALVVAGFARCRSRARARPDRPRVSGAAPPVAETPVRVRPSTPRSDTTVRCDRSDGRQPQAASARSRLVPSLDDSRARIVRHLLALCTRPLAAHVRTPDRNLRADLRRRAPKTPRPKQTRCTSVRGLSDCLAGSLAV
jgi:hypothetical protein